VLVAALGFRRLMGAPWREVDEAKDRGAGIGAGNAASKGGRQAGTLCHASCASLRHRNRPGTFREAGLAVFGYSGELGF
jgi:hypothetical protein